MIRKLVVLIIFSLVNFSLTAQDKEQDSIAKTQDTLKLSKREKRKLEKDSLKIANGDTLTLNGKEKRKARFYAKAIQKREVDPLAPSKAAFYSAILPGLGQIYNKRYWKVPIVYGALGTSLYFYFDNDKNYDRFRDAYKRRLAGFHDDEFYDIDGSGITVGTPDVSDDALRDAQDFYQRKRDLALLITIGIYALNIIDANVDAHLKQFNINDDLSFKPILYQNQVNYNHNLGFVISYNF
ncbi:DUF5683 domain-containing protein [Abyssalbus ytuae]|uniref:DUF5683 domain-containing protein n=1 Tax=Abyssalbus ytuae TaxID=2926907 RepID=A0A9E7CTV7_9FLAO|nr:DUF5683 domain-containing protein [Abyssalbus ytuae]UOB16917.1 DUF5683 domain-containing protein [Abyssalbus ytuae]